jgi:hypothetical protein
VHREAHADGVPQLAGWYRDELACADQVQVAGGIGDRGVVDTQLGSPGLAADRGGLCGLCGLCVTPELCRQPPG